MPAPNGDMIKLTGEYDEASRKHYLGVSPETLYVLKRSTRVIGISATNKTKGSFYKPIVLEYRIFDGASPTKASVDPKKVFDDAPNASNQSFVVPDDGKPVYFCIKEQVGLKERPVPGTFQNEYGDADEFSVFVRFKHDGWADSAIGHGEHCDLHMEC